MNVPSDDASGLADAVSDSIAALSVLAYPELLARVAEQLEPFRIIRHAGDCARRMLQGAALLRKAGQLQPLGWVIDAEPLAQALCDEVDQAAHVGSLPGPDLVRLARELLRHLLLASGAGPGAVAWDPDRDTIPPLEYWTTPPGRPGE